MKSAVFAEFLVAMILCGLASEGTILFSLAQTGTQISGIIASDTTWSKANSPYNLTGTVTVKKGVTLKIEAGATVNTFNHYIQVNGTLKYKERTKTL